MKAKAPFNPNEVCRVAVKKLDHTERHHQLIFMPDGQMIPKVVWTRVYDNFQEAPYVIAKIYINISEE
jgi:hypothetical protein